MPASLRYRFVQRFRVSAPDAFRWCTDYQEDDLALMGAAGKRHVTEVTDDTLILTDTFRVGRKEVVKEKLVRLYPKRLWWSNTHVSGPNRYSQFIYAIVAEGARASRLEFEGFQLEYVTATPKEVASMARKVRREDSASWKRLAAEMELELSK